MPFTIKCNKCGSNNVLIYANEQTLGEYPVAALCQKCNHFDEINSIGSSNMNFEQYFVVPDVLLR